MRFQSLHKNSLLLKKLRRWVLFIFLICSTGAEAQKVTLSVNSASIESVFNEIKNQTGYSFVYTSEEIKKAKPVSLYVKSANLNKVLELVFKNQPLSYSVEQSYIVVTGKSLTINDEKFEIKGRVLDEKGDGIAGVSVKVQNSDDGTATKDDGSFLIKTEIEKPVLSVSSIGYEPAQLVVADNKFLIIRLKTAVGKLDEQLIIAYGNTTKRLNIGTVSKLKGDDIAKQPVSNLLLAFGGRIAGVQIIQTSGVPGGNVNVLIRGRNSLANGNDPLYIIDGVPFPSTSLNSSYGGGAGSLSSVLGNVDPTDIESIEILKDADATAIYGSRGANGVILITTKKTKPGKVKTEVSAYTGTGMVAHFMDLLNTSQYLQMRREAFKNDGVLPTTSNARDLLLWDTTRYTDWQKKMIGNIAGINDFSTSLSGGADVTSFMLGATYHNERTVYSKQFGEEKIAVHSKINHHSLDQKFNLFFENSYVWNNSLLPQLDMATFITLPPDGPPLYDSSGNLNWQNSTWTNPLSNFFKKYKSTTEDFISSLVVSWKITPHLEIKANMGNNIIRMNELITTPLKSYDPAQLSSALAYAGFGNNTVRTTIVEPQLNYSCNIGKKIGFHLLGGGTYQRNYQDILLQTGFGFTNDALIENIKAAPSSSVDNANKIKYKYLGVFSRATFDYNKKYLVNFTARRDGSSRFGPENRFANFGSVGAGWIFSDEKLFSPLRDWLSFGKIKASYGVTGNDQIGDYKYYDLYASYTYPYQNTSPLYPTQLFNPNYGWEKVKKKEIGLDVGLLKDKIVMSGNYYLNETSNQLVQYPLPTLSGFSGILMNLPARIRNTGLEFELNTTNLQSTKFEWTSSFSITVPKNKLISYPGLESSSYATSYVVGQSLFIAKRYSLLNVDPQTGVYIFEDYDKDGKISSPNDQQKIIFIGQNFYGSLGNSLRYKNWLLSFFFQFVKQDFASNYLSRFGRPGIMANQPVLVLQRWQVPGDNSIIQKYSSSNAQANIAFSNLGLSDKSFSDASFIRLKNFFLSYQILSAQAGKARPSVKMFIKGQNLFTFTHYIGLDPETKSTLPPLRTICIGVQCNFQ